MTYKKLPYEQLVLAVLDAAEEAGVSLYSSQARNLTDSLVKRFPILETDLASRKKWTHWTDEEYERLRELWAAGVSWAKVGEELGKTRGQINGAVTRLGLRREKNEGTT